MTNKITAKIEVQNRSRYTRTNKDYYSKSRVYFTHKGETILENFGNRIARPQDLYKTYLGDIAEALGLPRQTKFRWSQKAGCGCGCSPGYICNEVSRKDVYVTLTNAPKTNNVTDDEMEAASRKIALLQDPTMP
jgi:hypothetical protein